MSSIQMLFKEAAYRSPHIPKRRLRVLLAHLMQTSVEFLMLYPETEISSEISYQFLNQVKKLSEGMPLSRLMGKREFWGMEFELSEATLDPRPDSETLIEAVLAQRPDRHIPFNILDLGTGTGCLIISLLKEYPKAQGVAVDQSQEALDMAQKNARYHKVEDRLHFHKGDWLKGIEGQFDIIISNPPYISDKDYEHLDNSVKNHDPIEALVGGEEGLDCYQIIIPNAPAFLKEDGLLVLEIGYGQREAVQKLMEKVGFNSIQAYKDLASIERCLVGKKLY